MKQTYNIAKDFDAIGLRLASPERIKEWSHGEVTKPETINYRTQRSEKHGLFDEKIFGPDKDYECYCGKYRGIRYKGITCEKCGVEITRAIVRRERMGHIELATPVSHIWFLRGVPGTISLILGMPGAELEKVVYFAGYIVTKVDFAERERIIKDVDSEFKARVKEAKDDKTIEALKQKVLDTKKEIEGIVPGKVLDEVLYHAYSMKYGTLFEAGIGAEAIYEICKGIDLQKLLAELEKAAEGASALKMEKLNKRMSLVSAMIASGVRPEWMFLTVIPVLPPALRPMVPLDGGRYATSDVNDLYRRVINRNNRLLKLKEIGAPEVILRNEKRILQEAVDALLDSSIRHGATESRAVNSLQRRELKSIADNLKGKRGLFRQNLLGKRVDYSGRSVIVVGPELSLDECGLPKHMALELFRPFVIAELLKTELAFNIRGANRLIEDGVPEVWEMLDQVIEGKYVLLNRAPTLHRLGIQAFRPRLIEGNAIRVHPLVCTAFNADFDGDQMAVHVPLSDEAQAEAREIMASNKNVLKPGSGNLVLSIDKLDLMLGAYWMTREVKGEKGDGMMFESPEAAIYANNFGNLSFRAPIKVLAPRNAKYKEFDGRAFDTTVGRILFNECFPEDYPFVNVEVGKYSARKMAQIVEDLVDTYGVMNVAPIFDKFKAFGFKYATMSGTTFSLSDIVEPAGKGAILEAAKGKVSALEEQYANGFLSHEERHQKIIEIWHGARNELEKIVPGALIKEGPVTNMFLSGARGSISQITNMVGMKGLITTTTGETIEFPVLSSNKAGLTPIEYFITTHGSRKGLTDTALNTAKSGYLTRKLFDVSQDVVVGEVDCGTKRSFELKREKAGPVESALAKNLRGRVLAEDVLDASGNVLVEKGTLLSKDDIKKFEHSTTLSFRVRSPLTCASEYGVCSKCYGTDLGRGTLIDRGEAVGTIAAQAIGEPGTQLTMRTFHSGGVASQGGDIVAGLPRVEEIFEKRTPKNPAVIASVSGLVSEIKDLGKEKVIVVTPDIEDKSEANKKTGQVEYIAGPRRVLFVKQGDKIVKGQILTDGSCVIDELFEYAGREATQNYIIAEASKIYELQGEAVAKKHIEVVIRQMFSRLRVTDPGETKLSPGDVIEEYHLMHENAEAKAAGKTEATAVPIVLGISDIALSRKSFLSAASFQHTTRILIRSAVRGAVDDLRGLKENILIGRLIPAGSGFAGSEKQKMITESGRVRREAFAEAQAVKEAVARAERAEHKEN